MNTTGVHTEPDEATLPCAPKKIGDLEELERSTRKAWAQLTIASSHAARGWQSFSCAPASSSVTWWAPASTVSGIGYRGVPWSDEALCQHEDASH